MTDTNDVASTEPGELLEALRSRTPARILVGRAGPAYRTSTQLDLRRDHAAALDAVRAEFDPVTAWGQPFLERWRLFEVGTQARDKSEYLMRPDLGRRLNEAARADVTQMCQSGTDLQVVVGDGLSAAAVGAQVPSLLPLLEAGAKAHGRSFGRPFAVRYCRVGVLNDIGDLLNPEIVVLLIGERPGLATAESLSAYMAYRPRAGHTDAHRNLISNIHARGIGPEEAANRVLALAQKMRQLLTSGVAVKEDLRSDSTERIAT